MFRVNTSLSPIFPLPALEVPMNPNQPDPPIRELRNRWPFFSEGELKWLLSPKRQGSGGMAEFCNEDTESAHMGITADGTIQGTHLHPLKTENGATICAGPEPSESPVAFSLEGLNTKETPYYDPHLTEALSTDFTFLNENFNEGEVKQSTDGMGHLGPRALNFQDETVITGDEQAECHVSEQMQGDNHLMHGFSMEVDGSGEESTTGAALVYEVHSNRNGHPGFSSTNPFAEGLEPLAGEDMEEEVPIDFTDPAFANLAPKLDGVTPVVGPASGSLNTLPEECDNGQESTQDTVDSDLDEDDDEMNSCVKRMSFDFSDGKQVPKFRADDVVLALNCGGAFVENVPFGFSFKEDSFFTGGDVLRTDETITGVHDSGLYQTARIGDVSYQFRDLAPGYYVVDLHFAEISFTNGPPGLRVFDVSVQGEKVISELDVYDEVGSNNALILSVSTSTLDGNLTVTFEGVLGSPTISAICIRSGPPTDGDQSIQTALANRMHEDVGPVAPGTDCDPPNYQQEVLMKDREIKQINEHKARRQQMKNKARKCVREYEVKLEELKNECHEAWISLQDSNRINEMLRDDLCAKSLCCDSLATAVETQLSEMNAIKERIKTEKQRWVQTINSGYVEIQALKEEQRVLAQEAKEWVASFPDPSVMVASVQSLVNEHQDLRKKYADECNERRQLYNKVLELKGNIRVFCRCRPLSGSEVEASAVSVAEFDSASNGDLVVRNGAAGKKLFKFDRVFSPQDDQCDVFADTAPVVVSVLDGFNVCIFAYGQTGTGKTFTMEGCVGNRGVNYRTLEELFSVAAQRKGEVDYDISVSVMEVYNEQIRDLLAVAVPQDQPPKKLEIKQLAEGGHHVPGLVEAKVTSMEEVWEVLQAGSSSRTVGSTRANDHSSRSHCMLCVMVKGENTITGECTKSKLWLVDLAGSERVAKSDAQGDRLKEAQSINKSLSALGDVIQALTTKSSHIPFRNSKLTHLLQDSLGGDSKTLMFVQISPNEADVSETLCSLNFASRVRGVELGPARKHLDSSELFKYKQLAERAKQETKSKDESVRRLEENLRAAESKLKAKEQLCQSLSEKVKEIGELDAQLVNEKRARQAAEASYREQRATMEKLAADTKLSMAKMSEKAAADAKQAVKEALDVAAVAHTKEVNRLLQQVHDLKQANEARMSAASVPAPIVACESPIPAAKVLETPVIATVLRRPALVETGSASRVLGERIPSLEYVVKPPDMTEVMRNSCTGEVFANENANPQQVLQHLETVSDAPLKTKGILKSSSTKQISPNLPRRPTNGKPRRTGFGVNVKPSVQVNSLVRRSQESSSTSNSVANSLSDEDLRKLLGGLDMIATSNTTSSTLDASLQTLAHVLENTTPSPNPSWKGSSNGKHQKSVHFRTPILLPPREGAKLDDLEMKDTNNVCIDVSESAKSASAVASKIARRTTLPSRPLGKSPAAPGVGAHRVVAAGVKAPTPILREKRWN